MYTLFQKTKLLLYIKLPGYHIVLYRLGNLMFKLNSAEFYAFQRI